jgi:hypothetical protein
MQMAEKMDKLVVGFEFDKAAVQEATEALNALTEAADRAKAAMDALFGKDIVSVSVKQSTDADGFWTTKVEELVHRGVRPSGDRFKL